MGEALHDGVNGTEPAASELQRGTPGPGSAPLRRGARASGQTDSLADSADDVSVTPRRPARRAAAGVAGGELDDRMRDAGRGDRAQGGTATVFYGGLYAGLRRGDRGARRAHRPAGRRRLGGAGARLLGGASRPGRGADGALPEGLARKTG